MRNVIFILLLISSFSLMSQTWQNHQISKSPAQFIPTDTVLWVGGDGYGLVQMDPESGAVLARHKRDDSGLRFDQIIALQKGPNGSVWVGHPNGLSIKNGERWYGSLGLSYGARQFAPITDSSGWVLTDIGKIWWFDGRGFLDALGMNLPGNESKAASLARDANGQGWASVDQGLVRLATGALDTLSWEGTSIQETGIIPSLLPDQQGGLWIFHNLLASFYYFHPSVGFSAYPIRPWFSNIHIDNQDRIWLSQQFRIVHWTPQGVQEIRPQLGTIYYPKDVFQLDNAGNVWAANGDDIVSGMGALVRYDPAGKRTFFFPGENGLWSSRLQKIALDQKNHLYISYGNNGLLTRYVPDTESWEYLEYDDKMIPYSWQWGTFIPGPDGKIWTSSYYKDYDRTSVEFNGVQSYDPATNTWEFMADPPVGSRGVFIKSMAFSPAGKLAISSRPVSLLYGAEWEYLRTASYFSDERLVNLAWDAREQLWAIQSHFNQPNRIWMHDGKRWDTLSVALEAPVHWLDILVDSQSVKWFIGNTGILRMDDRFPPGLGRSETWLDRDTLGLNANEDIVLANLDPNGHLWILTSRFRLLRFSCEDIDAFNIPVGMLPQGNNRFLDMVIDPAGRVFLANSAYGLYQMDMGQLPPPAPCMKASPRISDKWLAYPNPATDQITLSYENPEIEGNIQLDWYDLSGRLVRQETGIYQHPGFSTSVEGLIPGAYQIQIKSEKGVWGVKVFVGH